MFGLIKRRSEFIRVVTSSSSKKCQCTLARAFGVKCVENHVELSATDLIECGCWTSRRCVVVPNVVAE